ncbi:MAG: ATP-binding cassette domain-containing protein [Candidatus Methanoperedens sp.]|nr:ATP-binding cassette domain-containing protein [Candidatus Methanoperedens sp.]
MVALIEIQNLNINVNGKQILKNINLDINEGDSIGIIGKSGAGKSTLLHLLRGFEEFEDIKGKIIFNISICPKCNRISPPGSAACSKCGIKNELQRIDYLNSNGMHRKIMDRTAIMMQRTFGLYGGAGSVLEEIKIEEKPDREKTPADRNNDLVRYFKRAQQCAEQDILYDVDFYVSKAKETAAKLDKDISSELDTLRPAYEKGISEILKEAEKYASEGQIYGMHVDIENAINYATKAGIDISGELSKFMPAYEKGLEDALHEAEKHEAKGFLGMSYQYIHRAGNYAEKLGKNIDEILKSLPWYERWTLTDIHMKLR